MDTIKKMTIEEVLKYKGENLNMRYVIRCLPSKELQRTREWEGVKYSTFEDWFYANCV
jgi:hypothetical protein